jgi:Na+-translocating ferredoxin:NAD+ oxidoreductase subunit G
MKENLKLGLNLFIITAVAGLLLGFGYTITKEPIAQQQIKTKNTAMKNILPSAENFEVVETTLEETSIIKEINKGTKGSDVAGYAIKVAPKGYSGAIQMMVGISTEGKVTGISILQHAETPGLGANATKESWNGQYKDKSIDKPFTVVKKAPANDYEISSITGSTITSKAITDGVNEAVKYYNDNLKGGAK